MNPSYLLLRAILLMMWPPTVVAAGAITLDKTLTSIDLTTWVVVFVLSTMGGLTSLLHKLKTESPPRIMVYVCSHMLLAWFAGIGAFFIQEHLEFPDLVEIPLISFSAYMGGRFVDVVAEKLLRVVETRLGETKSPPGA